MKLILIYLRNLKSKKFYVITIFIIFCILYSLLLVFNYYYKLYDDNLKSEWQRQVTIELTSSNLYDENIIDQVKKLPGFEKMAKQYQKINGLVNNENYNITTLSSLENTTFGETENLKFMNILLPYSFRQLNYDRVDVYLKKNKYTFIVYGYYLSENDNNLIISDETMEHILRQEGISMENNFYLITFKTKEYLTQNEEYFKENNISMFYNKTNNESLNAYKKIYEVLKTVIYLLNISIIIIIAVIVYSTLKKEEKDLCLMKISGYNKYQILSIIILRNIAFLFLISIVFLFLFLFLYSLIFLLLKNNILYLFVKDWKFNMIIYIYIVSVLSVIILLANLFFYYKFTRKNIIKILKEN